MDVNHVYVAADRAVGGFLAWVPDSQPEPPQEEFNCLFDVIEAWVERGPGVEDCSQDFPTFLTAVTFIIETWHRGPVPAEDYPLLGAITKIADPARFSYGILNPERFMVARELFRLAREEHIEQLISRASERR